MRLTRTVFGLFACAAAGALAAHGLQVRIARAVQPTVSSRPPSHDADTNRRPAPLPPASFVEGESFYLQVVRPQGLAIDVLTPCVFTPLTDDRLTESVPDT